MPDDMRDANLSAAFEAARNLTDLQIKALERAVDVEGATRSPGGIIKEAAVLTACSNREASLALSIAADFFRLTVDDAARHLNATGGELGAKIEVLATLMAASEK